MHSSLARLPLSLLTIFYETSSQKWYLKQNEETHRELYRWMLQAQKKANELERGREWHRNGVVWTRTLWVKNALLKYNLNHKRSLEPIVLTIESSNFFYAALIKVAMIMIISIVCGENSLRLKWSFNILIKFVIRLQTQRRRERKNRKISRTDTCPIDIA